MLFQGRFFLSDSAVSHVHMISKYLCTLPEGCSEESESAIVVSNIGKMDPESMKTLTKQVDILISKNQALQILYLQHCVYKTT